MAKGELNYKDFIDVPGVDDILWKMGYFCGDFPRDKGILSRPVRELGFTEEDVRDGKFRERIHPEDRETYDALWERISSGREDEFYCEYRVGDGEGRWVWLRTQAVVIQRDDQGRAQKIMGNDRVITSRKVAESYVSRELMDTKRKLDLSESIRQVETHVASNLDLIENHESSMEQLRRIIGFSHCQIHTHSERGSDAKNELIISYPHRDAPRETGESVFEELKGSRYPVLHDLDDSGRMKSLMAIPLRFSGRFIGSVLLWHEEPGFYRCRDLYPVRSFADILAVAVKNSREDVKVKKDFESDRLTGFHTRKSFTRHSLHFWNNMKNDGTSAAVAYLTLDPREDGNPREDKEIERFTRLCRSNLRSNVIMGRYGNEEFVTILPDCSESAARHICERIRKTCESMEGEQRTTVSIGVSWGDKESDLYQVMSLAEQALGRAKTKGRNRVEALFS